MSLYLGTLPIATNSSSRNIGEIVASTIPLSDAGLHLLDGGVIQGGGAYDDFVTYIAGLVSNYPDLFETEANWQSSVSTYGVCGKFVYDSVNNTVRLPKITGFTEGTTDVTALGDLVEAGLPDHTHHIAVQNALGNDGGGGYIPAYSSNASSVIVNTGSDGSGMTGTWTDRNLTGYNYSSQQMTNASDENSIYGNSTTVQPQSIKTLYYIVIATSTKTSIEVDIDEVMTDLNGKASLTDLNGKASTNLSNTSNIASSFKSDSVGWGLPKYSALVSISSGYTATSKGFIFVSMNGTGHNTNSININGTRIAYSEATNAYQEAPVMVQIPVDSGDKITWSGTSSVIALFCPAKGV
ncbi:MAG: hypothetical protein J6S67_22310 [Methanobrevibacter sp.]|nr:hypothetical protein [Methanobrevibacter sp.]